MYSQTALTAARETLAASRQHALALAQVRKETLYAQEPDLAYLDHQATLAGTQAALAALEEDPSQQLTTLRQQLTDIEKERQAILKARGLPSNYLEPPFTCHRCQDTGFSAGKRCVCFRQLLHRLEGSSLPQDEHWSFVTFDLSYYPEGRSRQAMDNILERLREYATTFEPQGKSLLLLGKTGLGKTHLSLAVGKEVAAAGHWVEYTSAQAMMDRFERVRFDRDPSPQDRDFITATLRCDLLILDDLGAEFITSFSQSVLYHVLNERLLASRAIVVSTNLDPAQLSTAYAQRITSRLLCDCTAYEFLGKDIRLEKRKRLRPGQS